MKVNLCRITGLFIVICGLVACASDEDPAMPTVAVTAAVPPMAEPLPTEMVVTTATVTAVPPTATSTVALTPTQLPEPTATTTATPAPHGEPVVIGYSVEERPITSYRFGGGPQHVIFVGGIHGGYEWNTILLAYEVIDFLLENPRAIPPAVTVTIIPSANPDGQFLVTGQEGRFSAGDVRQETAPGRFNANRVDLNRNWDCGWEPTGLWRDEVVSAGMHPFSEPETQALRDFFLEQQPVAVIFWHSAANGVYGAGCPDIYPPALELAHVYGEAASYQVFRRFAYYPVTGDASDWLALQAIPSMTVELPTHHSLDWQRNLAGTLAVLDYYADFE